MNEVQAWTPYCGEAPGPAVWLERWNLDPVLLVAFAIAALALWHPRWAGGMVPSRRRGLRAAWVLALLLYVTPLCALSSTFFAVRVVHHMALALIIAPLLAFGLAPQLVRLPAPLWTSTALAALVFWFWHAPQPYGAALSSVPMYALMQLSLLASAVMFWTALRRADAAAALAALLATSVQMGLLGALITFAARPLYAPHFVSTLPWGWSALEDQQLAGLTMWAPGGLGYLGAAIWMGWRWMHRARPGPAPSLRTESV